MNIQQPSRRVLVFPTGLGLGIVSRTTAAAAAGYVIEDRFTEASATDLPSHTPNVAPVGSSWSDTGTWTVSFSGYANKLRPAEEATAIIESGISNVVITVDVETIAETFSGGGIVFRYVDADNYWFTLIDANSDTFDLYERAGGGNTKRDTASVTINTSTTYAMSVTANGTSITCTLDGGNELSYTSSSFQSATIVGLRSGTNRAIFDNFLVSAA